MKTLNKVQLLGRLGRDPDVKYFENERVKASFPLATGETYTNKQGEKVETTDWHNIYFWGPVAKVVEKYLKKGSLAMIEGSLHTRTYETDGVTKYITEIKGYNLILLDPKPTSSNGNYQAATENTEVSTVKEPTATSSDDFGDLPF